MLRVAKLIGVGTAVVIIIALVSMTMAQITPYYQQQNQCFKELFLAMSLGDSQALLKSRSSFHEGYEAKATYKALKASALLGNAQGKFKGEADSFTPDITKLPVCE